MAVVEFRGYVNRPERKTSKSGKTYVTYNVGVKQKEKAFGDRPEKVTWANFQVTDFSDNAVLPEEKSYVTVNGFLKVREVENDKGKRTFLDVVAQSVDVAEPLGGSSAPKPPASPEKDPWE